MKKLSPYFSQNPLNRLDLLRGDFSTCKRLKEDKKTLFLLFFEEKLLLKNDTNHCFFTHEDLKNFHINTTNTILLGTYKNINYFTISLKKDYTLKSISIREFANLEFIEENILGIIAQASAITNWHNSHRYCAYCGNLTNIKHAGWRRDCSTCKKEHFPKIDPVVIMLVTFGDYCLLGRGVNFQKDRYSCLAGYMESGETIEDAARRELYEEVGVIGEDVEYISSQPWPFPSTLMIGLHVKAKSQKLKIDNKEIADAKWVHKDVIKDILNDDKSHGFSFPPKIAIARNLLEYWIR